MSRRSLICLFVALSYLVLTHGTAWAEARACATIPVDTASPLQVVRGMADYKAAIDAGYAACRENYPEQFAAVEDVSALMRGNMDAELTQAIAVTARMLTAETKADKAAEEENSCADADGVKERIQAQIDGLYEKAYGRRHKVMSRADLVPEAQDSCMIVLDAIRNYEEHYRKYRQARHALFEAASKQAKASGNADRAVFRAFEKVRDSAP